MPSTMSSGKGKKTITLDRISNEKQYSSFVISQTKKWNVKIESHQVNEKTSKDLRKKTLFLPF